MADDKSTKNIDEQVETLKPIDNKPSKHSAVKDFFQLFADAFKYSVSGIKSVGKAIANPFKKVFARKPKLDDVFIPKFDAEKTDDNVEKLDKTERLDLEKINKVETKEEEPKTFWAKLWKILNTDVSKDGRKLSKSAEKRLLAKKEVLLKELSSEETKRLDHGVVFVYKAKTKSGRLVTGRLFGFSKMDINAFLLNEGYEPFTIENNKWIDFMYGDSILASRRMKNKDLIFWLTQLSTYVKAGITLADAMKILMNQSGKDKTKLGIYQSIVYELTMGSSFSEALEKQEKVFPALLINMIKAAEATGELEATLDDMIEYYTDIETTRKEMISAMTYPILVTLFAFVVIAFVLLYVIPQFSEIYESMEVKITGMTLFLLNLSAFLQHYLLIIVLVFILIIIINIILYKKVKPFRKTLQIIGMKIPVFGNIIIYNEMTIFSKTFASLLKNNVNITESINILSKVTSNEIYKEIMLKTVNNIAVGDRISEAFKDQWAVPEVAYHMIVTGESTGQLAEMMARVADFYQEQHHNLIASLKSLIEPVMIVSLAIVVGFILISVVVPMFDMYDRITLG